MAQTARVRKAAVSKAPLRDANFMPKRQRKQVRKSMIRAYLANRVAEVRQGREDRVQFYRNLRVMKQNRALIAREMLKLDTMVKGLLGQVAQVSNRLDGTRFRSEEGQRAFRELEACADDAVDAVKVADTSVSVAADELAIFARRRIYYTEVAA